MAESAAAVVVVPTPTKALYWDDTYRFEHSGGRIVSITPVPVPAAAAAAAPSTAGAAESDKKVSGSGGGDSKSKPAASANGSGGKQQQQQSSKQQKKQAPAKSEAGGDAATAAGGGGGGGGSGSGSGSGDAKSKSKDSTKSKPSKPQHKQQTDNKSVPATAAAAAPAGTAEAKPSADAKHSAPKPPAAGEGQPRYNLVLDETIFHPQGGGQPSDVGTITLPPSAEKEAEPATFVFNVEAVSKDERGVITHRGWFTPSSASNGAASPSTDVITGWITASSTRKLQLVIDRAARADHARLHTAGHLIDIAVASLSLALGPGKGNHSPETSYVEYSGTLTDAERDAFVAQVQAVCDQLIAADVPVTAKTVAYDEIKSCCGSVPPYLGVDKPARIIQIHAPRDCKVVSTTTTGSGSMAYGCPCGGTHVSQLRALRSLAIRKLEKKGKTWRVKYSFSIADANSQR